MIITYGSYSHDDNECVVVIDRQTVFGDGNLPIKIDERWDISGVLQANSQAALSTKITALETAYNVHGRDITMKTSSGGATAHALRSYQTVDGTRVTKPPSYPIGDGSEYVNRRSYRITVEGSYPAAVSSVLRFTEAITIRGTGGPRIVWLEPLNGDAIRQQVTETSIVQMTQSGSCTGWDVYPSIPAPIWPEWCLWTEHERSLSTPAINSRERAITWKYSFTSPGNVWGIPNNFRV